MKYTISFATQKSEQLRLLAQQKGITVMKKSLEGEVYKTGEPFTVLTIGSNLKKDIQTLEAIVQEFKFKH